jgi:hypothetical protein
LYGLLSEQASRHASSYSQPAESAGLVERAS